MKTKGTIGHEHVFNGFGCNGNNTVARARWERAPGTKSFAVTVYDPDAPTGSGWWHWVIFNILRIRHPCQPVPVSRRAEERRKAASNP